MHNEASFLRVLVQRDRLGLAPDRQERRRRWDKLAGWAKRGQTPPRGPVEKGLPSSGVSPLFRQPTQGPSQREAQMNFVG